MVKSEVILLFFGFLILDFVSFPLSVKLFDSVLSTHWRVDHTHFVASCILIHFSDIGLQRLAAGLHFILTFKMALKVMNPLEQYLLPQWES